MIKLNNKNITYVALADSNNSLKAPKEIWYADSNNSVKLVYRRKDALIEGEDYEKYHLLNGYTDEGATLPTHSDKVADIRVNTILLDNKVLTIELGQVSRNIIMNGKSPWFIPIWSIYNQNLGYIIQLQERNGNDNIVHNITSLWSSSNVITLDFQNKVAKLGDTSFNIDGSNYNFTGFSSQIWENPRTVGKIKISDELHLIPCKLLKPVPKWLDANGIRRQVGECGMIDLVSGKFYGNVNSVGTFTVENYYERKEWLVGDGSAYIDTLITNLSVSDYIKTIFDDSGNIGVSGRTWGREGSRLVVGNDGSSTSLKVWGTSSSFVYNNDGIYIYDMYFDLLNDNVTINNQIFTLSLPHDNGLSFLLFARHFNTSPSRVDSINWAKYKSFEIHNQINLIPCTLTMDLPASMDANNISRTKGTSGMWDLVSDRFYGNVANSGTFKAVNLAEGVDYEVHQWLIADIPIGIAMMSLPINSSTFNCTIEHTGAQANLPHLYSNGYIYFTNSSNMDMISVWNINEVNIPFSTSVGSLMTIESNEEYFKVNNISITKYGFPILRIVIQSSYNSNNASTTKTSKISVDGIERYIPVKLLKSIPSTYDANGIARQAGECGMYDTVNDLFYGNVASSGTFSVSDDS